MFKLTTFIHSFFFASAFAGLVPRQTGCVRSRDGEFLISVARKQTVSPRGIGLERREYSCDATGVLALHLDGGVVMDRNGRVGYIDGAFDGRLQFDKTAAVPESGSGTDGFEICAFTGASGDVSIPEGLGGVLAINGATSWYSCDVGGSSQIYNTAFQADCYAIGIVIMDCEEQSETVTTSLAVETVSTVEVSSTISSALETTSTLVISSALQTTSTLDTASAAGTTTTLLTSPPSTTPSTTDTTIPAFFPHSAYPSGLPLANCSSPASPFPTTLAPSNSSSHAPPSSPVAAPGGTLHSLPLFPTPLSLEDFVASTPAPGAVGSGAVGSGAVGTGAVGTGAVGTGAVYTGGWTNATATPVLTPTPTGGQVPLYTGAGERVRVGKVVALAVGVLGVLGAGAL